MVKGSNKTAILVTSKGCNSQGSFQEIMTIVFIDFFRFLFSLPNPMIEITGRD